MTGLTRLSPPRTLKSNVKPKYAVLLWRTKPIHWDLANNHGVTRLMDVRFGNVYIYRSSRNNYAHTNYRPYVEQQLELLQERLGPANAVLAEIPFRKPLVIATNEGKSDHATRLKNAWPAKGAKKARNRVQDLGTYIPHATAELDDDPMSQFRLIEVDDVLDTFVRRVKPAEADGATGNQAGAGEAAQDALPSTTPADTDSGSDSSGKA